LVTIRSKEWQQIFQQALQMAILTQGLLLTQLQVRGNRVLQVVVVVLQATQMLPRFLQAQVKVT
jgi:hypothetical protein